MAEMVEYLLNIFLTMGYTGIVVFMLLESSFFPFPSEIVMIPAGVLSAQGLMDPWIAISMGILGSILGALINYYLAVWMGKPLLHKYGKYLLMPPEKLDRMEKFFYRHGEISTFTGRLIPVVRQYISFPAGLSRMNIGKFTFFTGLGAGLWVCVLVWIGYVAGKQLEEITYESVQVLWHQYSTEITLGLLGFCVVLISAYIMWQKHKKRANVSD
ncbi:MAG: DedA family protein [candidate division Zixibacteria bacterium]|nr:DedA family protein [candidate division Zixibacteria bacterium]